MRWSIRCFFVIGLFSMLSSCSVIRPEGPYLDKSAVRMLLLNVEAYIEQGNLTLYSKLLTDDYVFIANDGRVVSRGEVLANLGTLFVESDYRTVEIGIKSIDIAWDRKSASVVTNTNLKSYYRTSLTPGEITIYSVEEMNLVMVEGETKIEKMRNIE